uniref:Aldehyde dehydrogenase domain-containing protein n=1 Tax=Bionectria ochroleuca TaxID=29856 RepID=A0A8H7N1Z7_BIOOC
MVITLKEPVGVCGIITPWNFPAAMITRKVAPAIAAGCSVVIKPPSETPFTALTLAKLALEAGIPANCFHVVPTKNRQASMELATSPDVKKLSFTGSTGVGKILTQAAAGTMKRVSMELGGNAPFIVFEDADLDKAVDGAMICKFRGSGQTCVCANRLLVHEKVKDAFVEKLVARVNALKLGRGIDEGTTQGPLINAGAVTKVTEHVADALAKGGVLHAGGKPPPTARASSTSPPSSAAPPPRCRSPPTRPLALSPPSFPSPPRARPSSSPTRPSLVSRVTSSARTLAGSCASPASSSAAWWVSTLV